MNKRSLTRIIYTGLQWTWGLPQTISGAGLYLKHRNDPHFDYNGARVTAWDRDSGISLGKFIFVPRKKTSSPAGSSGKDGTAAGPENVNGFLLEHEYGHTIQSLILGPFYLLLVGAPSFAWNRLPYFDRKRKESGKSYYSVVFERTASNLGERISASINPRQADRREDRDEGGSGRKK